MGYIYVIKKQSNLLKTNKNTRTIEIVINIFVVCIFSIYCLVFVQGGLRLRIEGYVFSTSLSAYLFVQRHCKL